MIRLVVLEFGLGLESGLESIFAGLGLGLGLEGNGLGLGLGLGCWWTCYKSGYDYVRTIRGERRGVLYLPLKYIITLVEGRGKLSWSKFGGMFQSE